jgi:hypothetical protein
MNGTIDHNITERGVQDIIMLKENNRIATPDHQRNANVWSFEKQSKFIDSIKQGLPFPMILLYEDLMGVLYIEDGLQRLTALVNFKNDKFSDFIEKNKPDGKKFSEWTELEKDRFLRYKVPILMYRNASMKQRIEIFDRFQNGSPLKTGERIHSLSSTPLVEFTIRMLNPTNGELSQRALAVWGPLKWNTPDTPLGDKRYESLLNMVALVNGAAHGFGYCVNGGVSKKYDDLRVNLATEIPINETLRVLNEILSIYEDAAVRHPLAGTDIKKMQKYQSNIGNFTGTILWSLKVQSNNWPALHEQWVQYMVSVRENIDDKDFIKNTILNNLSTARSWNVKRWCKSYNNVFHIVDNEEYVEEDDSADSE